MKSRTLKLFCVSSTLEEQSNSLYQKLSSQKEILNNEIEKFNYTNDKVRNEFGEWKETFKQKHDKRVALINEAQKLIIIYQQKMYV